MVFLAALVGGWIAERLRQSPVLGYILGGILVGPYVLGLVHDLELLQDFSEIGIILLMFTVGIDFSLSRLEKVKKIALLGGALQISGVVLLCTGACYLAGINLYQSFFLGCVAAMSSTMIVLRILGEQGESNSLHGQIMLGILIVQDLAVILMVSLLPELHQASLASIPQLIFPLLKSFLFIFFIIYLAQKVSPLVFRQAAKGSNNDVFLILALTMGLGIASLSHALGLSVALGAFLAGLVISESEYTHEILGKINSMRDAFVILFFVAVGMLVDPLALLDNIHLLLILLAVIIPGKLFLLFLIVKFLSYHSRIAFLVGMGMAQTGEFSFVMAKLGLDEQLISSDIYNLILASSIISILLTPLFIRMAPLCYLKLSRTRVWQKLFPEADLEESEFDSSELQGHVILVGYGRVGKNIGQGLQQIGLNYIAIDYDYHSIRSLNEAGIPYIYGDASNEVVLAQARPDLARLAIVALPDLFSNRQATYNLLKLNPNLIILARAHNEWEKEILYQQGAAEVIQPEMEAGLQLMRYLILHLNLPLEEVDKYLETLYVKDHEAIIHKKDIIAKREKNLKVREFSVGPGSPFAGKKLIDSQIREKTGCNVVTIKKAGGEVLLNPSSKETLDRDDLVVVMGDSRQILKFAQLNGGELQHG
jgi:CPA2 family monovalent cation:H+ antiporter-2